MFRFIVAIACLIVIGDCARRLRRWYLERRQLRWWGRRIVQLSPRSPAPDTSRLALRSLSKWGYVALVGLVIALACAPPAQHGNPAARITAIVAGAAFWSIALVGFFRGQRNEPGRSTPRQ